MAKRKKVILYGDGQRPDVVHAIAQVEPLIAERAELVDVCTDRALDLAKVDFDLLVNFGGDGSMLGAVRSMGPRQRPVAGINFGKMGFLASFELPHFLVALDELLSVDFSELPPSGTIKFNKDAGGQAAHSSPLRASGNIIRRERLILEATVERAKPGKFPQTQKFLALNEAVISRGNLSRLIKVSCRVDGEHVARYHADGLIVATPTGSTAHSLSAGGPVLEPGLEAFIVTPICPHTLALRPLVVAARRRIELEVTEANEEVGASLDGQAFTPLGEGDRLTIAAYPHRCILLGGREPGFYASLRAKLLWGGHVES